jgi:hypothetical protein
MAARLVPGAASRSSWSHFAARVGVVLVRPVSRPSGQSADQSGTDRIGDVNEHDRKSAAGSHERGGHRFRLNQHGVGGCGEHCSDGLALVLRVARRPMHIDDEVLVLAPAVSR